MSDRIFKLPKQIAALVQSRDELKAHYQKCLKKVGSEVELKFTLDGNLVGDLGEALAVELFGVKLVEIKSTVGIDGYVRGGKQTVQVKATGTGRGPAFRKTETRQTICCFSILILIMQWLRSFLMVQKNTRPDFYRNHSSDSDH